MQTAEPTDVSYLVRKIVWRSWIRSLSWLRRHRVLPA
jgi:hypothetical protein